MGWADDHSKSCHGCSTFDQLTAERDALREIVDHMTKHGVPPEHSYEVLRADNERLRAELECHAASEQGSVVANRKPGSPKDPQAETPVEAVRRFQRDYPLDTSDPYTKLFAIAELRTAQLTELREAFSTLADDIENRGYSVSATHIRVLLNKVTPIA